MYYKIEVKKAKRGHFIVTLKITNCDTQSLPPASGVDLFTTPGIYSGAHIATYALGEAVTVPEGDSTHKMLPLKSEMAIIYTNNLKKNMAKEKLTHSEEFKLRLEGTTSAEFEPPF